VAEFSTATKTATETTWPTPFRQLKGFGHLIINADEVFGTHRNEQHAFGAFSGR
jgi:hypothetical protein